MTEDQALARFGLRPAAADLAEIRRLLAAETDKEREAQGRGGTGVMRVLCVGLFNAGDPADALRIWAAKRASMDANGAIDLELLCGAGLAATKAWLESSAAAADPEPAAALRALVDAEASGDLEDFTVAGWAARCDDDYRE